jgi:hypothetical protein
MSKDVGVGYSTLQKWLREARMPMKAEYELAKIKSRKTPYASKLKST